MNTKILEAHGCIAKAREALRRGDRRTAWQLGRQAAMAAPDMEDAWLVLVASDPNPQNALVYARKALKINPESTRARRSLEWAQARMPQTEGGNAHVEQRTTLGLSVGQKDATARIPKRVGRGTRPVSQLKTNGRKWLYATLLAGAGCLVAAFAVFFALTSPALASIVGNINAPAPVQENLWAPVYIAKPTITPIDGSVFALELADSPVSTPSNATPSPPADLPASEPTDMPTLIPTEVPAVIPKATETPGTLAMEIVTDDSASLSVPADEVQSQYPAAGNGERWIDVNLSEQRVYAYEGDTVVNSFLVSTGVAQTPTVTGTYKIWIKVRVQDMSGPGYYLRDVPWVMFFYKDYGLHGTYWHNNFGTPMSRGCVNLTVDDAAWLFNWASVGTVVNVHY